MCVCQRERERERERERDVDVEVEVDSEQSMVTLKKMCACQGAVLCHGGGFEGLPTKYALVSCPLSVR